MKKILYILSLVVVVTTISSCRNNDDFTESIFDTSVPVVDPNSATAPFDQWLYDNFVVPYNVDVKYRFDLTASDLQFQLTPADYNRSQLLAHFIRYLFYDTYTKFASDEFMKMYGPRIFHFIGSSGYNASTGTEVLGTASGGVKITLYKINEMKACPRLDPLTNTLTDPYSEEDIDVLNENYFHTMHHEFSHILHQTKAYPVAFGQVTSSSYDPMTWNERDSVTTHQLGFVTHYASSATYEDFVETLSCIITDNDVRWMNRLINACCKGMRQGDKEEVMILIDSLAIPNFDDPTKPWNNFKLLKQTHMFNENTNEYEEKEGYVLEAHRSKETAYDAKNGKTVSMYKYEDFRTFTSFEKDFLPWVEYTTADEIEGINAILKKINIATQWYTENWGLHIFEIREEVRERQAKINDYIKNEVTIYDLK